MLTELGYCSMDDSNCAEMALRESVRDNVTRRSKMEGTPTGSIRTSMVGLPNW